MINRRTLYINFRERVNTKKQLCLKLLLKSNRLGFFLLLCYIMTFNDHNLRNFKNGYLNEIEDMEYFLKSKISHKICIPL